MNTPVGLRGLYAITSAAMCADSGRLLEYTEAALRGGARFLQYRDKDNPPFVRRRLAIVLAGLCRSLGGALIINDDFELARTVEAQGVHLGAGDPPLAAARAALGDTAIIGASCGASLQRARAAAASGANYVAFGRFFDSHTKPEAPPAAVELLVAARQTLNLPICAIGGVTPSNGAGLIAAGVDLVAAVNGLFDQRDAAAVERAARAYTRLFDPSNTE